MSMSMNLHTKTAENFEVTAKLTSTSFDSEVYPVIQVAARPRGSWDFQEVTIYPSFEQVKEMHEQLSKLLKQIEELEELPL